MVALQVYKLAILSGNGELQAACVARVAKTSARDWDTKIMSNMSAMDLLPLVSIEPRYLCLSCHVILGHPQRDDS